MYPTHLIYAFALPDRNDVTKLGKTEEGLARRLQDANSFHPFGVRFLAAWRYSDSITLRAAETKLKHSLPVYRSEWFSLEVSRAIDKVRAVLGSAPTFDAAALGSMCKPLVAYDNFSGKTTAYSGMSLKLRVWIHQRMDRNSKKEIKLSRNPWRRPKDENVSGTKYINVGTRTYAPDPMRPIAVYELPDVPGDFGYAINNQRVMTFYDQFCRRHGFDVADHLRTGWTPLDLNRVSELLRHDGFVPLRPFGDPLPGEHPKQ